MNTPLRDLIAAEPDVREVLELKPIAGTPRWRFLIETTYATFPRYTIGWTTSKLESVHIEHRCGLIETAREYWTKTTA